MLEGTVQGNVTLVRTSYEKCGNNDVLKIEENCLWRRQRESCQPI